MKLIRLMVVVVVMMMMMMMMTATTATMMMIYCSLNILSSERSVVHQGAERHEKLSTGTANAVIRVARATGVKTEITVSKFP